MRRLSLVVLFLSVLLAAPTALANPNDGASYEPALGSSSTATLVVDVPDLEDGTTLTVWTEKDAVVGGGAVESGRAILTLHGDDFWTSEFVEGAAEGERLEVRVGEGADAVQALPLTDLYDLAAGAPVNTLHYQTDAVWTAEAAGTALSDEVSGSSLGFELAQNYPNPFNGTTRIRYTVGQYEQVSVAVYDMLGRRVAVLVDEQQQGSHEIAFDSAGLASGTYLYVMQSGSVREVKRMTIL